MRYSKNKINITHSKIFFILMYLSLIVGFFLDENSAGGAKKDFYSTFFIIEEFSKNFLNGFKILINSNNPHFPLHYIILGELFRLIDNVEILRFLILNINILIPFFFYKCLTKIFPKLRNEQALLFSTIIFISPYFRSSAIWATTDNTALLFFLISLFFFLQIKERNNNYVNFLISVIFLGLSALSRFYYIIFFIYFSYVFIKNNKIKKKILVNIIFSFLFLTPSIWYYLLTKSKIDNFLTDNLINNFYLNISILLFYLIPLIVNSKTNIIKFINFIKKNQKIFIIISLVSSVLFFKFNYFNKNYGGGLLFQIIKHYFHNDIQIFIFYVLCLFGITSAWYIVNNRFNNLILILIFLISFNYMIVYQKYFDPLFFITLFTLFHNIANKFFDKYFIKNFFLIFFYFFSFLIICLIKNSNI
jgi:4-amino-4-deoxy-L-arabinose transferase-like glycosyltransferase